jgi:hypothetical protein
MKSNIKIITLFCVQVYVTLTPGSSHVVSWAVEDECPIELCIARNWNTVDESSCSVTLHFCGATPNPSPLVISGGSRVSPALRLSSHLTTVEAAPAGKLEKWITSIRPIAAGKVVPLGERDIVPLSGNVLYGLNIEYAFEQAETGQVKPAWPGLNGVLYEVSVILFIISSYL